MSAEERHDERQDLRPEARRKLGRGLSALLGEARREEPLIASSPDGGEAHARFHQRSEDGLATIAVALIEPHPEQPRRQFDDQALEDLAASIAERGVIQPVIVRPLPGGRYQLVAGERRWRAAQRAQLHEIPALIRNLEEREVAALALIENIQREDLNPVEEARAYKRLAQLEHLPHLEIGRLVGKSRSHVANFIRLLGLPEGVLAHLEAGALEMGHARALIGHADAQAIADRAVKEKLSVRDVEKLARRVPGPPAGGRSARAPRDGVHDADIVAVQTQLEEVLGLPVRIAADTDPRSGAVTIRYRTLDQLDLICQRLTGGGI